MSTASKKKSLIALLVCLRAAADLKTHVEIEIEGLRVLLIDAQRGDTVPPDAPLEQLPAQTGPPHVWGEMCIRDSYFFLPSPLTAGARPLIMKSVSPLGPRPRTTNPEEVTAMKGTMSAATVHKQYNEVVSAFRRLIADPALRARFDGEADGYFRRCALGVWQADNASSITPRHVEFYNAIYTLSLIHI